MKGKFLRLYKKRNEETQETSTVFVYELTGSKEDEKKYEAILKERGVIVNREETSKKLLYFDTIHRGKTCEIIITNNNKIVVDDMEADILQSQIRKITDPTIRKEYAAAVAQTMIDKVLGRRAPAEEQEAVKDAVDEKDADL